MATESKKSGWWNLARLSGSRAGVLAAVAAAPDVPAHWRECIRAAIAQVPAEFNGVQLDAHATEHQGLVNVNLSLRPLKIL
jgi:hypothetical protein